MATIVLKKIRKQYPNGFEAIPEINLEIADREFLVLVGPSGCAKSTALRMVAGLEDITSGDLLINGKLMNDVEPKNRNIAMVFQSYALYPHMTVYENIGFRLKITKRPKPEIDKRVKEAAEILGISDLLSRKPRQLSGGQRQRVALGRAIVRNPEVFLFDEPLSNLDAKLRLQMRTEIKKLHEKLQSTIIYVTHDQVEAMTMGSRVAVMRRGLIQQIAPPLRLYNHPNNRFVAGFIGSPSMNFVPCQITDKEGILYIDAGVFQLPLPDKQAAKINNEKVQPYTFGIRPEDIRKKRKKPEKYNTAQIKGQVKVIEPLGKEISLELGVGEIPFTAIIDANQEVQLHQNLEMVLNMDKIHLFKQTEEEENIL